MLKNLTQPHPLTVLTVRKHHGNLASMVCCRGLHGHSPLSCIIGHIKCKVKKAYKNRGYLGSNWVSMVGHISGEPNTKKKATAISGHREIKPGARQGMICFGMLGNGGERESPYVKEFSQFTQIEWT